jgi:hypothetical protein
LTINLLASSTSKITHKAGFEHLKALVDVKENFFYFKGFNNPARRRDFSPSFIASVERFLHSVPVAGLEPLYSTYVQPKRTSSSVPSSFEEQITWRRFNEFFDENARCTFDAAKSAFRKAALALHPDVGGDPAEMVALNESYSILLGLLLMREAQHAPAGEGGLRNPEDGTRGGSSFACGPVADGFWQGTVLQYPRSAEEFAFLLRSEALVAAIDLFIEDRHAHLADGLSFITAWAVKGEDDSSRAFEKAGACLKVANILLAVLHTSTESAGIDAEITKRVKELGLVWAQASISASIAQGRLAKREARQSSSKLQQEEKAALAAGRFPFVDDWHEQHFRSLLSSYETPTRRSGRFQLNHLLQAENAFRRGLVDEARFRKTMARLGAKRETANAAGEALLHYMKSVGFQSLEHDPEESKKKVVVRYLPEHGAGGTWAKWMLSSVQACRAYGEAYYRGHDLAAALSYVRQRLWITLSSLIGSPERWDYQRIEKAKQEVAFLSEAAQAHREGQAGEHARELAAFLSNLLKLREEDRTERLALLQQLAHDDFRNAVPEGLAPDVARRGTTADPRTQLLKVLPAAAYYEAAMRPLDKLRGFAGR